MTGNRARLRSLLGSGKAWATFWLVVAALTQALIWPAETIWAESIRFLNAISVEALVLACLAAFQASLSMRKSDPDDPL